MPQRNLQTTSPPAAPGGLTYWLLLLMGFSTFAPAVLLPEWREYQMIRTAEQVEEARAEAMAALVQKCRRTLDRLQSDPAVTARLAQRDLRYHRTDQYRLAVSPEYLSAHDAMFEAPDVLPAVEPEAPIVVEPVTPPVWLMRWQRFLPPLDYDRVFCSEKLRPVIIAMSVSLIGLAFVLFGRRSSRAAG